MTMKIMGGGPAVALVIALAATPASAAILKGYVDLYATSVSYLYFDDSGAWSSRDCSPDDVGEGKPCAKVRFTFEQDTKRPDSWAHSDLVVLDTYFADPLDEHLNYRGSLINLLGGKGVTCYGECDPNDHGLSISQPGDDFSFRYGGSVSGSGYGDFRLEGEQEIDLSSEGGFIHTAVEHVPPDGCYGESCFTSLEDYSFDNDPKYWKWGGRPEARVWVVGVPEPATVALLALGLGALGVAGAVRRRGVPPKG